MSKASVVDAVEKDDRSRRRHHADPRPFDQRLMPLDPFGPSLADARR